MTESDTGRLGLKGSSPEPGKTSPVYVKPQTSQHARFLETARALGCDEDEVAFDEKLKGIARQKPKDLQNGKDGQK